MLWEFYWMQKQTLPRRTRRGLSHEQNQGTRRKILDKLWLLAHHFFKTLRSKKDFWSLYHFLMNSCKIMQNWHFSSWFQFLHSWKWGHFHLWMLSPGSHFSLFTLFFLKITPTKRQQNDRQNLDGFPETPRQSICEVVYIHLSNPTNNPKKTPT